MLSWQHSASGVRSRYFHEHNGTGNVPELPCWHVPERPAADSLQSVSGRALLCSRIRGATSVSCWLVLECHRLGQRRYVHSHPIIMTIGYMMISPVPGNEHVRVLIILVSRTCLALIVAASVI